MKKFYIIMLIVTIIVSIATQLTCAVYVAGAKETPDYYPLTAQVVAADDKNGTIIAIDSYGNMWAFTSTEEWSNGDGVTLLMDEKRTAEIYDDEIIGAWFYPPNQLQYFINNK